ncbi:MAG: DUF1501 domain-containing protein [Planctomycetia bacterium]|nr:DUF1501 domain-containing protein [Planctomycetia bacterium]
MLTILGRPQRVCGGVTRRQVLQAGGAGLFGMSLSKVWAAEAQQAASPQRTEAPKAKSVIFLFLFGGPSQLETFDLKPDAPSKIRGPFNPIASKTPGLLICEHLPRLAAVSDKLCVVRTMTHPYNDHSTAGHYIQTGHPWHVPIGGGFNATEKDWPAMGSVVEYVDQHAASGAARDIPSYVYLPNRLGHMETYSTKLDRPGQYAGWLGRGYDALATDIRKRDDKDNPYFRDCTDEELDYRIKGLAADEGLSLDRLNRRRSLLDQFDDHRRRLDRDAFATPYQRFQERALSLVTSEKTRQALDVRQEPAAIRDRYGRHLFGQSVLLARRLVEAGARFVTVGWDAVDGYSWDSHVHSDDVQKYLLPGLDSALGALVTDLDDRGLLDETLVVCVGEMGRTPAATPKWGRGHWSTLFPAVLAGGGIRGGIVYGRSDRDAALPQSHPTSPEELAATIFHAMGIDPGMRVPDAQGRPTPLLDTGAPVYDLFG